MPKKKKNHTVAWLLVGLVILTAASITFGLYAERHQTVMNMSTETTSYLVQPNAIVNQLPA